MATRRGLGKALLQGWMYSQEERKRQQELARQEAMRQRERAADRSYYEGRDKLQRKQQLEDRDFTLNLKREDEYKQLGEKAKISQHYRNFLIQQGVDPKTLGDGEITKEMFDTFYEPIKDQREFGQSKQLREIDNAPAPERIKTITPDEDKRARSIIKYADPTYQFEERLYGLDEASAISGLVKDRTGVTKPIPKEVPLSSQSQEIYDYAMTLKPDELMQSVNGGELAQILESLPVSDDEAWTPIS